MADLHDVSGLTRSTLAQLVQEALREELRTFLEASLKQGLADLATGLRAELRQICVAGEARSAAVALRANSRVLATPSNNTLGARSDDTAIQRVRSRPAPLSSAPEDSHEWTVRHIKSYAAKPKPQAAAASPRRVQAVESETKERAAPKQPVFRHAASSMMELRRAATAFQSAVAAPQSPSDAAADARPAGARRSLSFITLERSASPQRLSQLDGTAVEDCPTVTVESTVASDDHAPPCTRNEAWNAPIIASRRKRPDFKSASTTVLSPHGRRWAIRGQCSRAWHTTRRLIKSSYFDYLTVGLTLLNAVLIGAKADFMARHATGETPAAYRTLETIFCIIFTVEICLRLATHRWKYFTMPMWRWNVFDCVVITAELVKEFLAAFGTSETRLGMDFCFLRAAHFLRVIQVVRVMRVVRYINELRTLAFSILHSAKALVWTLILLGLIIFMFAVGFTQLVGFHTQSARLRQNFGSLGSTVLTLFQSVTGGIDWREAMDPLFNDSPLLAVAFTMYIAFVLFAVLNIITGVFVDAALRNAKQEKDDFMINNVRELFLGSTDTPGELTWEDFQDKLDWPQMLEYFRAIDVDPSEAKGVFQLLDMDDSGVISSEEFLNGCLRLRGPASALDLALLMHEVRRLERRLSSGVAQLREAQLPDSETAPEGTTVDRAMDTKVGVNPLVTVQEAMPGTPVLLGNTFGAS